MNMNIAEAVSRLLHAANGGHLDQADAPDVRTVCEALRELDLIASQPVTKDFLDGVTAEATFQRAKFGKGDAIKQPEDWFWLLGYLGGKALRGHLEKDRLKALHHTISAAAVCCNWHERIKNQFPEPLRSSGARIP